MQRNYEHSANADTVINAVLYVTLMIVIWIAKGRTILDKMQKYIILYIDDVVSSWSD